jgi:hypothetical protein
MNEGARPRRAVEPLILVREHKLFELLPGADRSTRLEASGVEVIGDHLVIVMDEHSQVLRLPFARRPLKIGSGELVGKQGTKGYEDLSYDRADGRLLLLREAVRHKKAYAGEVVEWDSRFERIDRQVLPFTVEDDNTGFEGLAWTRRAGVEWLLALCEGNFCRGGKKGRTPGGGRIQAFTRRNGKWKHAREIALPADLPFEDYSSLAMLGDRVAVVSQESSMLWVGELAPDGWDWDAEGQLYEFPRSRKGKQQYFSVEGIAWLGSRRVIAVSDRRKKEQPSAAEDKDQSIHVFDLP